VDYFYIWNIKSPFAIAKPLLATNQEQRKPDSTSKGTNSTKRQQFDRKIPAFAGHFRIKTGIMQSLQKPALYLFLYSKYLTLYCKCLTLALHKILRFFSVFNTNWIDLIVKLRYLNSIKNQISEVRENWQRSSRYVSLGSCINKLLLSDSRFAIG
jgi:hypothetical protein